jgi:DNA (cytosine-5)-methyltransferase 1
MGGFTFVDICCGLGAFHIALKRLGGRCVLACEKSETSRQVYVNNHGSDFTWHDDLYTLRKLPRHDVFCAGFPCTTFSLAGYRRGTDDQDAGRIIFKILELLKESKPRVVILENVPGLMSIHNGETLTFIKNTLASYGYNVEVRVFDAADYSAPIHRKRLIIAATRDYSLLSTPGPKPQKKKMLKAYLDKSYEAKLVLDGERYVLLPKEVRYSNDSKIFAGYLTSIKYGHDDLTKMCAHRQALKIYDVDGMCENFTSTNKYAILMRNDLGREVVRYLSMHEMYVIMGFPTKFKLFDDNITVQLKQISNSINLHMLKPVCAWVLGPLLG